jgi:hypothetical protein
MSNMASIKIGDMVLVKKRSVTRPILQIGDKAAVYFRFDGEIHEAPLSEGQSPKKGPDGQVMRQPDIAHVLNLETGEESTIVCNSVLKSEIMGAYPDKGYIGKSFAVEKTGSKKSANGTTYTTFGITEVEVKAAEPENGRGGGGGRIDGERQGTPATVKK